jgi:hypothetical protein
MKSTLLAGLIAVTALSTGAVLAQSDAEDSSQFAGAKKAVIEKLKDPGSATFKDLAVSKNNKYVVCGHVNAKNSYGGYVGFRRFVAFVSQGKATMPDTAVVDENIIDSMWGKFCAETDGYGGPQTR